MSVDVGDMAPDFDLPTNGGGSVKLSDLRGKKVVIFFYSKALTSGCTKEACGFRDALGDFSSSDTVIIGMSKDEVKRLDKWIEKEELTFTLASDFEQGTCEAYDVWKEKSMYGNKYMGIERSTFLIDRTGKIASAWRKVRVPGHVDTVLAAAQELG
ncbi:MAG: thioredoxin-dependent thiol peroxidase [Alphaproteobacteria bacterium TMED89]|nr:thioredoxin-dependent thiol peroxidase [Rhodospirillaceae bacterium]RPH19118.1 MAG: thioredoxin-dependent thiol peroxidase [Alphaproteobacteria bacterium TMED89]